MRGVMNNGLDLAGGGHVCGGRAGEGERPWMRRWVSRCHMGHDPGTRVVPMCQTLVVHFLFHSCPSVSFFSILSSII